MEDIVFGTLTKSDVYTIKKVTKNNVLKPLDTNKPRTHYPLPKGDSFYAQAKRSEYVDKDLSKAEELYKKAIKQGDRPESAVKDLAGLLHQQGKTLEAIQLLKKHKELFNNELPKYRNLMGSLRRQISTKGNRLNKNLKIFGAVTKKQVMQMFRKPHRILGVELKEGYAIAKFPSHSAARKTLETKKDSFKFHVEFSAVSEYSEQTKKNQVSEAEAEFLLGSVLYRIINS